MRFLAGVLPILLSPYIQSAIAPWCGFTGEYGQPSEPLCNSVKDLDLPRRDDIWRIFAPDAILEPTNSLDFPKVPTPVKHQRWALLSNSLYVHLLTASGQPDSGGCAIAVYNINSNLNNDIESLVLENWRRVLEAVDNILGTCIPHGGSQHPIDGLNSGLMIYVYEPGADIEINFNTNSVGTETTNGHSGLLDSDSEAVAEILRSVGTANGGSTQRTPPNSPQTTYCLAKASTFACIQHTLKSSVLFGNALSTFDVVSTYA
ncbi:MAG: hypothetical protein M1835_007365 [Candelina submexicana]|nr:MAG: hypothetical protein M1835_007365 [Candelina submexicana]